jgi:DnaK suppressor protein
MRTKKKGPAASKFEAIDKSLRSKLAELRNHVDQLRRDITAQIEIDDEVSKAFRNRNCELIMATIERETQDISEIESALQRVAKNKYGICLICERTIPENRLRAIPWTRRCVDCAGGGITKSGKRTIGPALKPSTV